MFITIKIVLLTANYCRKSKWSFPVCMCVWVRILYFKIVCHTLLCGKHYKCHVEQKCLYFKPLSLHSPMEYRFLIPNPNKLLKNVKINKSLPITITSICIEIKNVYRRFLMLSIKLVMRFFLTSLDFPEIYFPGKWT